MTPEENIRRAFAKRKGAGTRRRERHLKRLHRFPPTIRLGIDMYTQPVVWVGDWCDWCGEFRPLKPEGTHD